MEQTNMPIGVKFAVIHRAFRREMDTLLRQKDLTGAQFGACGRWTAWNGTQRRDQPETAGGGLPQRPSRR